MLDRNRRIKKCPERFQHCAEQFDLIITAEERVYDQVSYSSDFYWSPFYLLLNEYSNFVDILNV